MTADAPEKVRAYFLELQDRICSALEDEDAGSRFHRDPWERGEGGGGLTRVLADGEVFEQAGVGFSHVRGASLPPSSTVRRPELAGRAFTAMGVSVVVHPRNPHVPTSHMNLRFLVATADGAPPSGGSGVGSISRPTTATGRTVSIGTGPRAKPARRSAATSIRA